MVNSERIEFAEAFKSRTKKFVVDNINFLKHYLKLKKLRSLDDNYYDLRPLLAQTTGLRVGPGHKRSFMLNFPS